MQSWISACLSVQRFYLVLQYGPWSLSSLKIRKEGLEQAFFAIAGATSRAHHTSIQHILAQPYTDDDPFLNGGPQNNRIRNESFLP